MLIRKGGESSEICATGETVELGKMDTMSCSKLEKIFKKHEMSEEKSIRTTMIPQLGIDKVAIQNEEPF